MGQDRATTMRKIQLLPNLITLGNAFCGLLAMSKAIDALAHTGGSAAFFYARMEQACMLVFIAMVLDALDGFVARLTKSASEIGAQLDSFADAVTFGVTPAVLALVLVAHEGAPIGYDVPRLHILAAASFPLLAILRLARFNLESDAEHESHTEFRGLPSPASAGSLCSTMWLYLILRRPELEVQYGAPTPFGRVMGWMRDVEWTNALDRVPPLLLFLLPALGLLMVSRLRFAHVVSFITYGRSHYYTLVWILFLGFLIYLAPVPWLFILFNGYVLFGFTRGLVVGLRSSPSPGHEPGGTRESGTQA
jgi:CDP-diacylglycerol--serine O-phosphatidyltransferase